MAVTTKSRCFSLVDLISNFSEAEKQAVEDIGFGGLLSMKLTATPKAMIPRLIKAFDVESSRVIISEEKSFLFTKDDVVDVFGLPSGPSRVEYLAMGSIAPHSEFKAKWRGIFGNTKSIALSKLLNTLRERRKADDLFKQMFVLYAISAFLAPTSNSTIAMKLLKSVEVVDEIKNMDWCSHIYSELVAAIQKAKTAPPANLQGCFLLMMVSWFHRFDYGQDNLSVELPLIKHWTDEKLSEMMGLETAPGKFGTASFRNISFPL